MAAQQLVLAAIFSLFLLPALGFPNGRQKSLAIIREINKNGPYLGLITVYSAEEDAFFATGAFNNDSRYPYVDLSGKCSYFSYFIFLMHVFIVLEQTMNYCFLQHRNPICLTQLVGFAGRRFRVGRIRGKKVIYVRCGIGMVFFLLLFQFY